MDKILNRPFLSILILACLSVYFSFLNLGNMALTDPDETFYAQSAKEMFGRGERLTPYLYGNAQFEKPIMIYWLIGASYKTFGVNEFAARFPSAVFGLIGIIALYLLGARLFNKRAAFFSAVALATCVEYIILTRACITDMVLSTFMLLGFLFFIYAHTAKGESKYFCMLSAASFALATLTKGPIAIILGGGIILIYLFLAKDIKFLKKVPFGRCLLVFLAIAVPWYAVMYKIHGKAFIDSFFGFQNVTRFLEPEHKSGSQFYYNVPVLFGGLFPWSAFLPFGLWRTFNKVHSPQSAVHSEKGPALFLLVWFLVIFVFFSISSTKLVTYIFPCFPALALMIGAAWDEFLDKAAGARHGRGMRFSYYILSAAILTTALGLYIFMNRDLEYRWILAGATASASFLLFGMAMSFAAFRMRKHLMSFLLIGYACVIFFYPFVKFVLPSIEVYETSKNISKEALLRMGPGDEIGCERDYRAGVAFYTGLRPADIDRHHLLTQFLSQDKRVWCVMKEKNMHQLYDLDHKVPYTSPSYLVYRLGKKCLFTNRMPEGGKYILKRERKGEKI